MLPGSYFCAIALLFAVAAASKGYVYSATGSWRLSARSFQQQKSPLAPKTDTEEVLRIETTLVTVPVMVSDRAGKYLPGLRAGDFRLFEDGVAQELAFFQTAEEPLTIGLMLDVSDSAAANLSEIQAAASAFVNQLRPDDQVAVFEFDSGIRELAVATNDRPVLHAAIRAARPGGGTRLYDAVELVLAKLAGPRPRRRAIILFSDGVDVDSATTLEKSLRMIEEAGCFVYPIQYKLAQPAPSQAPGLAFPVNKDSYRGDLIKAEYFLRTAASVSGARFYLAEDRRSLAKSFAQIADELRASGFDSEPFGNRTIAITHPHGMLG